ncbi:MAG: MATE family efflux transporter, partial [Faecalibacterium sp.]|nr:MATE family efflux transporter [Faecalibacterium sp.]MDY5503762.1 MATE family efflux transporter [Faecalibacterium sp.]
EVHNLYRKSLRLIAVVAVTLTLASMFIIPCVARVFVGYDAELLALTSRAFRLYALSFLIMGFNVYASSFFTALGDGVTSALISFLRTLAFQVIAILLLPMLLGIDGIWLAVTAAELAALAVSAAMLLTKDKVFHYRKA